MTTIDTRQAIVAWAIWLEQHHNRCLYSEGPNREANLNKRGVLSYIGDCSSTVRNYFNFGGAPDPYKLGWNVAGGYTGTELATGEHIQLLVRNGRGALVEEVRPGDPVVYGPGTGWHTGLVVKVVGTNLLTVSFGRQGGPNFAWTKPPTCPSLGYGWDGREPLTYLRFPTLSRHVYYPPGVTLGPAPLQTRYAGLRRIDAAQEAVARHHGWTIYGWNGKWFTPWDTTVTLGNGRWASIHFKNSAGQQFTVNLSTSPRRV